MNLLRFAIGLIRDAVETKVTQEVSNMVRPSPVRETTRPDHPEVDVEALLADHRAQVRASLDQVMEAVNKQNARLERQLQRQRAWNFVLAAGVTIALILAILAIWI
jgi:hypothetical protein